MIPAARAAAADPSVKKQGGAACSLSLWPTTESITVLRLVSVRDFLDVEDGSGACTATQGAERVANHPVGCANLV
jgi:hypothetical protein